MIAPWLRSQFTILNSKLQLVIGSLLKLRDFYYFECNLEDSILLLGRLEESGRDLDLWEGAVEHDGSLLKR